MLGNKQAVKNRYLKVGRLGIIVFLTLSVTVSVFFVIRGQRTERSQAASDVQIYLNAGTPDLVSTKTVDVMIDTRGKRVTFANVVLNFDPNVMQLSSAGITPSDKLKNTIVLSTPAETASGVINIVLASRPEDLQVLPSGVFQLARFVVSKKSTVTQSNLSSTMTIDTSKTQVVDSTNTNMSLEVLPLVFKVNPTVSSSPTSTPQVTTLPTKTPTATPAPTGSSSYSVMLKNVPHPSTVADLLEVNYVKIGTTTYQETNSFLVFSSKWTGTATSKYTTNTETVRFTSTQPVITLGTSRGSNRGTFQVFVNDVLKQTIVLTQAQSEQYEVQIDLR